MGVADKIYDVMVIGTGFAGMAASLSAADRGLDVVLTGSTGGIDFSAGVIDLMGVHPISQGTRWENPWEAIEALRADHPQHPYARLTSDEIRIAIDAFTGFLADQGLPYRGHADRNVPIAMPVGTKKHTFRVCETAWGGVEAMAAKASTLICGFKGLKGFSAKQMQEMLGNEWPIKTTTVEYPYVKGELFPEPMGWAMVDPRNREALAESVKPYISDVEYIGFPAVLGLENAMEVVNHLQELTGKRVFEIPTLPPSIAGNRLRSAFDRGLPERGVTILTQKMVSGVEQDDDGLFTFRVEHGSGTGFVRAKAAILATGRFFGKGLKAGRDAVREPIFGLDVAQPGSRSDWHAEAFFDLHGNPVNMAGIETDGSLRPLEASDKKRFSNLFVAGAVLAHHDWTRMKCGAGMAIATGFKAAQSAAEALGRK